MATLDKTEIAAHIPVLYGRMILQEAQALSFWEKFIGPEGSNMPIISKEDLTKEAGDTIRIHTVKNLTGAGVSGDSALETNEEQLAFDYQDVSITQYRHATRHNKTAAEQGIFNLAEVSRGALARWLATNLLDTQTFTALTTSPDNIVYAGDATTVNTIDSADDLDTAAISLARVKAEDLLIPPAFVIDGQAFYGMVVHPYQAYSLKQDTVWQNAQRDAMPRGMDNPLFTGALGHWDGVVLYPHSRVPRAENANSPAIYTGDAVLFGAGAAVRAYGRYPEWIVETFDYGNQIGTAIALVTGIVKVTLDNIDQGLVIVRSAAVDPNA
jgi:N4-gp56 family major capsid protein